MVVVVCSTVISAQPLFFDAYSVGCVSCAKSFMARAADGSDWSVFPSSFCVKARCCRWADAVNNKFGRFNISFNATGVQRIAGEYPKGASAVFGKMVPASDGRIW